MHTSIFKQFLRFMAGLLVMVSALLLAVPCGAMPPHPDLEIDISKKSAFVPPALKSKTDKDERGIDSPSPIFSAQKTAVSGTVKALVVLISFSDKTSSVSASYFDDLIFGSHQGTVADYYNVMGFGQVDIVSVDLPSTLGWFTAPQPYSYYANGEGGTGAYPNNSQKLCEDIVEVIDASVDFSQYDGNSDGFVDALIMVHTGTGGEYSGDGNDIWSHKWGIWPYKNKDGINIYEYTIQPEYWENPGDMTCGVFCHELGHLFGLPDLYDIDNTSNGIGRWSIMASGSWLGSGGMGGTPSSFDAWSRIQLGFNTASNVTSNTSGANIASVISGGPIYRLWSSGGIGDEYYLVENRQQTGYDAYLPGNGLLIWHIDDSQSNNSNEWYPGYTSFGNYMVALEQADGLFQLEQSLSSGNTGDPFPGSTSNTTFAPSTTPGTNAYDGANTYVAVTNISSSSPTMTADFQVSLVSDLNDPDDTNLPVEFSLSQNYPNPFNPGTVISLELNRASHVSLTIYNILGQPIIRLLDEHCSPGTINLTWDGHYKNGLDVPTGVYFYEIITEFGKDSRKMTLIK